MLNVAQGLLGVILAFAVYHVVSGNKPDEPETNPLAAILPKTLEIGNHLVQRNLRKIVQRQSKESRAAEDSNPGKEVPDCNINVTLGSAGEGTLHSPYYPSNYANNLHCVYRILTPVGYLTQLSFEHFNLEPGMSCMYDSLQVFANNGTMYIPLSGTLCGSVLPVMELIYDNVILIELKTDFSQTSTGFLIEYRVFVPGERCMFGADQECAFPCHCEDDASCNRHTGACKCKDEAASGDFVGDQWSGIGCQTGNVALYKPATQSGTGYSADPESAALYPMTADQATDGNRGQADWMTHCAWVVNQDSSKKAWWIVDLEDLYQISTVIVYNTNQTSKYQTLAYFNLKYSQNSANIDIMQGCHGYKNVVGAGLSHLLLCPMVARYIGIERFFDPDAVNSHTMALCEVKVIGHKYYAVDCTANGTCVGNCYPGLYCDQCELGYRQPECTRLDSEVADCGVPEAPSHGNVRYSNTWSGAMANYTCEMGYEMNGDLSSMCNINGEWKDIPTCKKVNCGAPPLDDSAETLEYTGTLYGDQVSYACPEGYRLVGNAIVECTANATWDSPAPMCQLIACGQPPDIDHAYLTGVTGNVVSSVATYACEEGFLPRDDLNLVCEKDGNWSSQGDRLECTGVPCKLPPSAPEHGYVSYSNGSVYTSVVEYMCDDWYYMQGVDGDCFTISCRIDGTWSDMPPQCMMECGGVLTHGTGSFTSPNWPNTYDNNRRCSWLIKAARPGDKILLRFSDFNLEASDDCAYDHINIYDSNGKMKVLISTHCGDDQPAAITTVGNYLLLEFVSDPAEEGTGFRAEYAIMTSHSMQDVTAALGLFYKDLLTSNMMESDIKMVSEAVVYLKSYMLTIENSYQYAECLFVLEAEDGLENILYYHSVPRLKQYLYNTFDRMIYHIPQNYHTAQVIMDLIQRNNLTRVYDKLMEPLTALQINIQHILGMEEFRCEPVLFSAIEEPLLEKLVEYRDEPAANIVLFVVDAMHDLVLGNAEFNFHIDMLNCPPIEVTAVNLVYALENATESLAMIMASLPHIIDEAFGPGAEDIVEVYKHELIEQIHILQHPFHVLIAVRNKVLSTFTLKEDVGEAHINRSKTWNELDVEMYIKSTEPITAAWLQYIVEENLKLGLMRYILKDIEHHLLKAVPHASDEPIEEISLVAYELMIQASHERILTDMPGYCLDGKLTAMLTGFLEIHLVDIAMSDLNISNTAMHIADLLVAENAADIDVQTLKSNIADKLRARLFNMFKGRLLDFDNKLELVTNGPISTETLPMDVVIIITSEKPRTMGELVSKVVHLVVPSLLVNVTCVSVNWTAVHHIVTDFIHSFDDLSAELLQTFEQIPLTDGISNDTANIVKALILSGLTTAKDHLLQNFRQLHLVNNGEEDRSAMETFFIENLAQALFNIVQMVTPYESSPTLDVEGFMEVIEWQHNSLQELVFHYMQGLRKLLDELGNEDFNPCEAYPHICKLSLLESLTTKRNQCVNC